MVTRRVNGFIVKVTDSMKYDDVKEELTQAYVDILKKSQLSQIYIDQDLSGIFLACPSEAYFSSSKKLMVIGQETRSWRNSTCAIKNYNDLGKGSIVESMRVANNFNRRKPGNSKFRQRYKEASIRICSDSPSPSEAAVWANQFCISYKGGSPINSKSFDLVKEMSYKLLRAQMSILKPDIALFFTGSGRDRFIKECFPSYETLKVFEPRRLWSFKVDETTCFRTNHPRWGQSSSYIDQAIEMAESHNNRLHSDRFSAASRLQTGA